MKVAVVTTTINVPVFFEDYCRDFSQHGHQDVSFFVIGDRKTPQEVAVYCERLQATYGYRFEYYDPTQQVSYLSRFPELADYLPWDSVQRRNIGMIRAYETGHDLILTVDDDNYLREPDLLRSHLTVGTAASMPSFRSSTGWFDPCQFLASEDGLSFHHRGFPMAQRWQSSVITEGRRSGRVAVNIGMWVGDPDVDAWVRMAFPLQCHRWTRSGNFTLDAGIWAPFNSQQTAVCRHVLPAYFLNPNCGRYDDIWASYIIHRLANHLGDLISYGSPIVNHVQKRSIESLWRDLDDERMGAFLTDDFVEVLRSVSLTGTSYAECYGELAEAINRAARTRQFKIQGAAACLMEFARGMEIWGKTVRNAGTF